MTNQPVITVVGSTMADLITYLERMPDRGETIFGRSFAQGFGGEGAKPGGDGRRPRREGSPW